MLAVTAGKPGGQILVETFGNGFGKMDVRIRL